MIQFGVVVGLHATACLTQPHYQRGLHSRWRITIFTARADKNRYRKVQAGIAHRAKRRDEGFRGGCLESLVVGQLCISHLRLNVLVTGIGNALCEWQCFAEIRSYAYETLVAPIARVS